MTLRVMIDVNGFKPIRAHRSDAGFDLRCPRRLERPIILPGGWIDIDTGVHVAIPEGNYGRICSKSGLHTKHGIYAFGGIIDSGYTGSILVRLYNWGNHAYTVQEGDKIAQLVIQPLTRIGKVVEVSELPNTERGNGGFGSTGR